MRMMTVMHACVALWLRASLVGLMQQPGINMCMTQGGAAAQLGSGCKVCTAARQGSTCVPNACKAAAHCLITCHITSQSQSREVAPALHCKAAQ